MAHALVWMSQYMLLDKMLMGLMYLLTGVASEVLQQKTVEKQCLCYPAEERGQEGFKQRRYHQHQACCRKGYLFYAKYILCVLDRMLSGL